MDRNLRTYVLHQITLRINKPFPWAVRGRFRGNEARSDDDLVVSRAI